MIRFPALLVGLAAAALSGFVVGAAWRSGSPTGLGAGGAGTQALAGVPHPAPPAESSEASVRGRVVDEWGQPVPGAVVVARLLDAPLALVGSFDGPPQARGAVTDDGGHFSLTLLEPGRYVLHAVHRHHAPGHSGPVPVAAPGFPVPLRIVLGNETLPL